MSVLETAIGWLAPPECVVCGEEGAVLCPKCAGRLQEFGARCWRCNRLSPGSKTCESCRTTGSPSRVYIHTDYQGIARDLLTAYKFDHQRSGARLIARLMAQSLRANGLNLTKDFIIVPIPTATSRVRHRGFDHTALIAKYLSAELEIPYARPLRRLGHTTQLGSSRENRLKQLSSKFITPAPGSISGQKILLLDDVVTTGGTIIAAARALRQAGASRVDALLFSKRL